MTFQLYASGGEVGAHAKLLRAEGWENIAVSYWHLHPRLPKKVPWMVGQRLSGASVLLDSGGAAINKKPPTVGEIERYAEALQAFTLTNADDLDLIVELDAKSLGQSWIVRQREFYAQFGDRFIPVWHPEVGLQELDALASQYERVGIPEDALEEQTGLAARTNALVNRHGTQFHALASAKPDDLRSVRFTTATTGSWLSPTRYGETVIWDGTKLHRYPARLKDQARRRQAATITRAGFDADLVAQDDNAEITRLALWSLKQLEASVTHRRPDFTLHKGELADSSAESPAGTIVDLFHRQADHTPTGMRNAPVARNPSDRAVLPVVAFESVSITETDTDGSTVLGERLIPKLAAGSMRQCDSCFVAATCPAMKPQHACAFDLPVSITTKDQLLAVLRVVIEIQTQRVMFGRFAEELAGGYPDANLSVEIERLFKIVSTLKKLEDNNSFLRLSVEASAGAGILSRIFGERAGQLRELPGPLDADRVLDGALNGPLDS